MKDGLRTHIFKLTSGVECEVTELSGKHQRILTEQSNKKIGENLSEMLRECTVRVGEETNIDDAFVRNMLASDRKHILVEARQFTMDFEEKFVFTYPYTSKEDGTTKEFKLDIDLKDGVFDFTPTKKQFTSYSDLIQNKKVQVELPKSKTKIEWTLLDGHGEQIGLMTKRSERSSHTPILMRNPQVLVQKDDKVIPYRLTSSDLDKMAFKDIEAIRTSIKENEGRVDTEIKFEHPEAELLSKKEREVIVDLVQEVAFFFPSEAI